MNRKTSKKTGEDNSRFWQKISLMADIAGICRAKPPVGETFEEVLKLIDQILPFDGATLFLFDKGKKKLVEKATCKDKVELLSFLTIDRGDGLTGWTALHKKPVLLAERTASANFDPSVDFATVMSVPMFIEEDILGVLNLGSYRERAFIEKDVRLMTVVADQFAIAIERQLYQKEIETKNAALREAHNNLRKVQKNIVAEEKMKAVVELAASVNHEINNPLAVIVGNIQCMFIEKEILNQKMLSRLKRIESAAMQISEVNNKLLKINTLVSENYLESDHSRMLNLDKSSAE
ncbi:MAG: GAF domain-containing protein [candidate division Zixibacteria bacterium]|nr:GAF domain-containing protein [candidate division Zixibacteria bacterium]MDD5425252.1 GAF domain-containing protein [candidate division Zixibacteria bacterium]